MRSREVKFLTRGLTSLGGSVLATAAGIAGLCYFFPSSIARLSYDLPFAWRDRIDTREVALVFLDDDSAKKLHQPLGDVWNRDDIQTAPKSLAKAFDASGIFWRKIIPKPSFPKVINGVVTGVQTNTIRIVVFPKQF